MQRGSLTREASVSQADRVGMSVDRYRDGSNAEKDQLTYVMRRRLGGALMKPWCWVAMKGCTEKTDNGLTQDVRIR